MRGFFRDDSGRVHVYPGTVPAPFHLAPLVGELVEVRHSMGDLVAFGRLLGVRPNPYRPSSTGASVSHASLMFEGFEVPLYASAMLEYELYPWRSRPVSLDRRPTW